MVYSVGSVDHDLTQQGINHPAVDKKVSHGLQDSLCGITLLIRSHVQNSRNTNIATTWRKSDARSDVRRRQMVRGTVSSSVKTRTAIPLWTSRSWRTPIHWRRCGCVPNRVAGRWVRLRYTNPLAHPVIKTQTISHIVQRFQHGISGHNTKPLPADTRAGVIKVWPVRWQDVLLVLHSDTTRLPFTIRSCTCKMRPTTRDGRPPVACVCTSHRLWTAATPTHGTRQRLAFHFYLNFPILGCDCHAFCHYCYYYWYVWT